MINQSNSAIVDEIQRRLDHDFPSPEADFDRLITAVTKAPDIAPFIEAKRLALEIGDLMSQCRWHLGQALLIERIYPDAMHDDDPHAIRNTGVPVDVFLTIRKYVPQPERVLYDDLSEHRLGGTVAGWVYHMMIDNAVYRSIALMDRLARLLCLVTEVKFSKVYFRSGKMKVIHEHVGTDETKRLLEIADSPIYQLLLDYRDGLSHTRMANSKTAGNVVVDTIKGDDGSFQYSQDFWWGTNDLLALGTAAFRQSVAALQDVTSLCVSKLPLDTL